MNLEVVEISDSHAPTLLNAMNLEVVEISDSHAPTTKCNEFRSS